MSDIKLIVKMPEIEYEHIVNKEKFYSLEKGKQGWLINKILNNVKAGIPLPKGHGKIVDIGKIDEDRIDGDNPIISLSIGGYCIEAVKLDYLDDLPPIIEAERSDRE